MAQVVGGTDFDFVWDDKTNRCLILLREAADLWATRGRNALDPERVLAAFLQVLARPGLRVSGPPSWRWPLRFFPDGALEFAFPMDSCKTLAPKESIDDLGESVELLKWSLAGAADLWALGDPENPTAKQILDSLLKIMWDRHLAVRPPSRQYPKGL